MLPSFCIMIFALFTFTYLTALLVIRPMKSLGGNSHFLFQMHMFSLDLVTELLYISAYMLSSLFVPCYSCETSTCSVAFLYSLFSRVNPAFYSYNLSWLFFFRSSSFCSSSCLITGSFWWSFRSF